MFGVNTVTPYHQSNQRASERASSCAFKKFIIDSLSSLYPPFFQTNPSLFLLLLSLQNLFQSPRIPETADFIKTGPSKPWPPQGFTILSPSMLSTPLKTVEVLLTILFLLLPISHLMMKVLPICIYMCVCVFSFDYLDFCSFSFLASSR